MEKYESLAIVKILVIGDAGVGKTQITKRYADETFSEEYLGTIGVDFKFRSIEPYEKWLMKMQIWDTAGIERYRDIRIYMIKDTSLISYFKGANWVVVVYDITSRESFDKVEAFVNEAKEYAPKKNIIFVWGNKIDMNRERVISTEVGFKAAERHKAYFIETSAKDGTNIEIIFNLIGWALKHNSK